MICVIPNLFNPYICKNGPGLLVVSKMLKHPLFEKISTTLPLVHSLKLTLRLENRPFAQKDMNHLPTTPFKRCTLAISFGELDFFGSTVFSRQTSARWWFFRILCIFTPKSWGRWSQFDVGIVFLNGLVQLNHQPSSIMVFHGGLGPGFFWIPSLGSPETERDWNLQPPSRLDLIKPLNAISCVSGGEEKIEMFWVLLMESTRK